jgi:hypothetical protein
MFKNCLDIRTICGCALHAYVVLLLPNKESILHLESSSNTVASYSDKTRNMLHKSIVEIITAARRMETFVISDKPLPDALEVFVGFTETVSVGLAVFCV